MRDLLSQIALRARKVFRAFEKQAQGINSQTSIPYVGWALLVLFFGPRGFSVETPVFLSRQTNIWFGLIDTV